MGKVLFVDDDPNLLSGIRRQLRKRYDVECAEGPSRGLEMLERRGPFAVVVSDMRMPEMNGVDFLSKVAKQYPDPVRVMLTGNSDQQTAIDAVNKGHVFSFLSKPCDHETLGQTLDAALDRFRFQMLERELLEKTLAGSVKVLLDVMRIINPIAFGRTCALQEPAQEIAQALGSRNLWEIKIATLLSTVGWITVPEHTAAAVMAGQALSQEQRAVIEGHPEAAYDLLRSVPRLEEVSRIIRFQRRNFDGSGPPDELRLAYEDIPLGSRILRVLNATTLPNQTKPPTAADIESLPMDDGRFDPAVLAVAADVLRQRETVDREEGLVSISISAGRLLPGDVLQEDLRASDGTLLLSAGNEVSSFHIAKLRNHPKYPSIVDTFLVSRSG
jgi:response regulator RpfG family c-di-GMP phosphodiesterase